MDELLEKKLRKLVSKLRRQATLEWKRVGPDSTHYEGMKKGLALAYEESAGSIMRIISEEKSVKPDESNLAYNLATDDESKVPSIGKV